MLRLTLPESSLYLYLLYPLLQKCSTAGEILKDIGASNIVLQGVAFDFRRRFSKIPTLFFSLKYQNALSEDVCKGKRYKLL